MKKKLLALFAAGVLAFCAFAVGCTPKDDTDSGDDTEQGTTPNDKEESSDVEERELRVLPENLRYEVKEEEHTVAYEDSEGKSITLYGKPWIPKEANRYPAVILCHGFNGRYTDFPTECKAFAERGYVCYAFDFCGAQANGKSTGRTAADYTPFTMKEDLRAAISNIKKIPYVDKTQVFLFGGSQGGFVTALTAADEDIKDEISGLAMYFPALNIPDDWRGKPEVETPLFGNSFSISGKYIHSVQELDPFTVIGNYKKDVCIVWGDKDDIVRRTFIDRAVAAYGADRVDLTVLEGAGHGFSGTDIQTATQKVLSYLEAHTYVTKK